MGEDNKTSRWFGGLFAVGLFFGFLAIIAIDPNIGRTAGNTTHDFFCSLPTHNQSKECVCNMPTHEATMECLRNYTEPTSGSSAFTPGGGTGGGGGAG
jgi:hypothetical protein